MSTRNAILGWSERGAIADARAALDIAGALPRAQHWRAFLDRLLLWSGAVALAAAVVFFIAHNWNDLGKRSEEHTSELQSHSDLVCRLLLEKKKIESQIKKVTTPL